MSVVASYALITRRMNGAMFKRKSIDERLKIALIKLIEDEWQFAGDLKNMMIRDITWTKDDVGNKIQITLGDSRQAGHVFTSCIYGNCS